MCFCVIVEETMIIGAVLENLEEITASVVAIAGALGLSVPKIRRNILSIISKYYKRYRVWRQKEIYEGQQEILEIIKKGAPQWDMAADQAKINHEQILRLQGIVTNGLSHSVAKLIARLNNDLENDFEPKFLCDENGHNWGVSIGYRRLVGVMKDVLSGHQWENVVCGELRDYYLESFYRSTKNKEDFVSVVDFQNPISGEHRGKWRVLATCSCVGDSLIYSGRFIKAEDDTAKEIARENGWESFLAKNEACSHL